MISSVNQREWIELVRLQERPFVPLFYGHMIPFAF